MKRFRQSIRSQTKGLKRDARVILDSQRLREIRDDIDNTILPSWLPTPPRLAGSTKHGHLSADQWRSLCGVHFPLTLIRLWGGRPKESKEFKILENFIHLVCAVNLGTRRSSNPERRASMQRHLVLYLKGLESLYPNARIKPNHHLALHVVEFLKSFGPPHSWWAYPFERLNGLLQRIHTNHKFRTSLLCPKWL